MFLKHLSLNNIRCFESAELDFDLPGGKNRKWTVLLGENGTGKTTVLKTLALAMAGSDALSELVGDPRRWIRSGADHGTIRLSIETARGEVREISLDFLRSESRSQFLKRATISLELLDAALEHTSRNYLTVAYGASRRLGDGGLVGSSKQGGFSHPRARSLASLFDREAELNPIESWAMRLDYSSDGQHLGVIRKVLSDFLPDTSFSHIDKSLGSLMFDTPDGAMPLRQLSDGYQNVAAWVGDLLFQITNIFGDYKDPLEARGVLIIDEVDLHLHPKWQRRLLGFLDSRLPNMQLVVTTHSVVTAQQAKAGALHYCVRRPERLEIEAFAGDPGKLLLNQLISTEAFGNASDESLRVEKDKQDYRELHHKASQSAADRARMEEISDRLGQIPEDAEDGVFMTVEQRQLMAEIQRQYPGQK